MLVLPQVLLDSRAQDAGSLSVNDIDFVQSGQYRLIQVQAYRVQGLFQVHSPYVAFALHRPGHHAGLCPYRSLFLHRSLADQTQLGKFRRKLHHSRLQTDFALFIRRGQHCTFHAQGQDLHLVAFLHGLRRFSAVRISASEAFRQCVAFPVQPPAQVVHGNVSLRRVLLHLLQLGDYALAFTPCLVHNMLRFLTALAQHLLPFLFHLPAQLFRFITQAYGFPAGFFRQLPFLFSHLPVVFRVGDHVFKSDRVSAQQFPGRVDQVFRQAQPPADLEGVALSGYTNGQAVGRPQRFHVKFH